MRISLLFTFGLFTSSLLSSQIFAEPEELDFHPVIYSELNDMDQDGDMDLMWIERWHQYIMARENDGEGNYSESVIIADIPNIYHRIFTDMDNDGDTDILYEGAYNTDTLGWYENMGFSLMEYHSLTEFIPNYKMFHEYDYNNDGFADILVLNDSSDLILYENSGMVTFEDSIVVYEGVEEFSRFDMIDINGDNQNDILIYNHNDDLGVRTLKNIGNGSFTGLENFYPSLSSLPNENLFHDFDNDGDNDMVVSNTENFGYIKFENGSFDVSDTSVIETNYEGYFYLYHMDLDEDGDDDLVLPDFWDGIWWIENYDYESYSERKTIYVEPDTGHLSQYIMPQHINHVDFDFDGRKDLLVSASFETTSPSGSLSFFKNILGESCTDSLACNFNPIATIDDGTCCYSNCGCTNSAALNFSPSASCNNYHCCFTLGDFNCDNSVTSADLTIFLDNYGNFCNQNAEFCLTDLNGDGLVSSADLSLFLAVFGD